MKRSIGKLTFTEMMYFQLLGKRPDAAQTRILDAVLVTLMEHGLTPSVIATRMIYTSCPEALQAAVAADIDAVYGRHLTINATGAVAALLGEIGIPQEVMRGIAVVSRPGGSGTFAKSKRSIGPLHLGDDRGTGSVRGSKT